VDCRRRVGITAEDDEREDVDGIRRDVAAKKQTVADLPCLAQIPTCGTQYLPTIFSTNIRKAYIINRRRIEEVSYNIVVIVPLHRESVTLLWEKLDHEWDNEAKAIPAEIIFMAQDYPEDRPLKI